MTTMMMMIDNIMMMNNDFLTFYTSLPSPKPQML